MEPKIKTAPEESMEALAIIQNEIHETTRLDHVSMFGSVSPNFTMMG
jgi:hypothetical protein